MVSSVETPVDSAIGVHDPATVVVRMFGPLTISRDGEALTLPASRKVRALFAYLALAPHAIARSQLCELLWDVPNDPRGELRWCLSKIRSLIDDPARRRVDTQGDTIRLDLADCFVDSIEIARVAAGNIETIDQKRLPALVAMLAGDFLDGLDIDRSPAFTAWLTAQRRRFRGAHAALLERLVGSVPDDQAAGYLAQWLELAPFDPRVHGLLFDQLVRHGQLREANEHLAATVRLFEAEDLDCAPVRDAWRSARAQSDSPQRVAAAASEAADAVIASRRASIAVTPFVDRSTVIGGQGGAADGLAHDVITRLAKLRSLFVIAQGTMFALHERNIGPEEAGKMLNVDYIVSGSVQRDSMRLTVMVELAETRTGRVVWAEVFDQKTDNAFLVLNEIGNRIVASVASEIEAVERNRAVLRPPNSLDAWGAYHRGLWHMYRFTKPDNERAQHFLQMAVRLDPTFSRAYAGLSFTYFQNAFQDWAERAPEIDRAYATAGQSLMVDDRDPAAHWAMGRALWLKGRNQQSIVELEQAVELSPNFALGHYTLGFVRSQAGDPQAAISSTDYSRHLSPFDPLLFAMLGVRAMSLARIGRFEEAAEWGLKAASRPNAHAHVLAIAALCLTLADRHEEANGFLAAIRKTLPRYSTVDFVAAMRFSPDAEDLFRNSAKRLGMG